MYVCMDGCMCVCVYMCSVVWCSGVEWSMVRCDVVYDAVAWGVLRGIVWCNVMR